MDRPTDRDGSTQPPSSRSVGQKRSRLGCFTCKTRKVKCNDSPDHTESSKDISKACLNCQRLGFACRWKAPIDGETYAPPPKRRRTAASRSTAQTEASLTDYNSKTTTNIGSDQELEPSIVLEGSTRTTSAISAPEYISSLMPTTSHSTTMEPVTSIESDAVVDDPFLFESNSLDYDLAVEGLDFLPLPSIDPSALPLYADVSAMDSLLSWPQNQPDAIDQQATSSDRTGDPNCDPPTSPTLNGDNRKFVQHYLNVLKGYSKVDDSAKSADNLFIAAFTQSLCFPPLFHAILAFSAAHMSMQDPSYTEQALKLDQVAQKSIEDFQRNHSNEVEGLLSALFVRAKKMHIIGDSIDSFLSVMNQAAQVISTEHGEKATKNPSNLVRSVILRLAILDARAGCFRLGGGVLIRQLRAMKFLPDCFDIGKPADVCTALGSQASLLRANMFRFRVGELDTQLHEQLQTRFLTQPPLRTSEFTDLQEKVLREIAWWEQRLQSSGEKPRVNWKRCREALDSRIFTGYIVLSCLHGALLYLKRLFPTPDFDRTKSVTVVLRYQLQICHDSSRRETPSSILPSSLFVAALSTVDPVHQDWILETLRKGEKWGIHVRKIRELLEYLYESYDTQHELDICDAMDQTMGRFLI